MASVSYNAAGLQQECLNMSWLNAAKFLRKEARITSLAAKSWTEYLARVHPTSSLARSFLPVTLTELY